MRVWVIAATSLAVFAAACGETKTQRQSGKELADATAGVTGAAIGPGDGARAAPARSDLTNREVRDAQIALKQMGLYAGEIDGLYGRLTIAAVKEFQALRDSLPYTGTLDQRTLQEIRTVAAAKSGPPYEGKTRSTGATQFPDTREAAVRGSAGGGEMRRSGAQID